MKTAKVTIYGDMIKHQISKNLFGHFTEHCADLIYESVYAPNHPLADEDGFRTDALEALREVGIPMLRYPGGNFVSNYHWLDGVGPKEKRPTVFDYAWHAEESNQFGTVEFIKLCRKIGAEPYICVNMGSGTAEEAMNWVEFCNGTGDTKYAALRKSLGYKESFAVKYWGLGNEMYGDWQFGKMSATDYAKKALDFAKAMTWFDPTIKLIASGHEISSEWNYTVAKTLKPLISHIAIHHYSIGYGVFDEKNYEQCMYVPEYIAKLTKVCYADIVAGTDDALTDIKVAWDEWNTHAWDTQVCANPALYNMQNTMMTALILHSFMRDGKIVDLASYSPFINMGGALSINKDGILKRGQYYVFKMLGEAFAKCPNYLACNVLCDSMEVEEVIDRSNRLPEPMFALDAKSARRIVQTPNIDCICSVNDEKTKLVISIVNKQKDEEAELSVSVFGLNPDWKMASCKTIYNADMLAANTDEEPNQITISDSDMVSADGIICVKEHSVNVIEIPLQ